MKQCSEWFQRRFVGTELGGLLLIILAIVLLIGFFGHLLTPVLASIVVAYLLDGVVNRLVQWKIPHFLAVNLVFLLFIGLLALSLLVLLPLLWDQLANLLLEIPAKIKLLQVYFNEIAQRYPSYVSSEQISHWMNAFQNDLGRAGKLALAFSISTISNVIMLVVYLVLVPLMVYFFLKDRQAILIWLARFLPKKRRLSREVWKEIHEQFGEYIRAKILEVLIVAVVTTIVFLILGLNYAVLLGVLVGLSAIIPYVGVILVTVPVLIIGYLQWGFSAHFVYLSVIYVIIMILDGNVLTPLLFSGRMNLHPVSVIIAILIFGGLWGFWGIFFAIPLASVCKVLINAGLRPNH